MRSRLLILISLVVLAAVALVIGVAVAGAGQSDPLPAVTAPELLAKMAQAKDVTDVSGEIAWHNGLFGDLSQASGMAHMPAQSPLTSSGSGRIWVSAAGTRVESQGGGGDQVVVVDKAQRTAWVYDYAANTAKKVVVTGSAPAETASPAPAAAMLTPEAIALYLQRLSALTHRRGRRPDQGRRPRHLPAALHAGRAGHRPRLRAGGHRRRDHAAAAARGLRQGRHHPRHQVRVHERELRLDRPVDVRVHPAARAPRSPPRQSTRTRCAPSCRRPGQRTREQSPPRQQLAGAMQAVQGALLTRGQVAKLVPYELAYARDYTARPYQWGAVLGSAGPLAADGSPLLQAIGAATGMDLGATTGKMPRPPRRGGSPHSPSAARPASCSTARAWAPSPWSRRRPLPSSKKQLKQAAAGLADPGLGHGQRRQGARGRHAAGRHHRVAAGRHHTGRRRHGADERPGGVRELRPLMWTVA